MTQPVDLLPDAAKTNVRIFAPDPLVAAALSASLSAAGGVQIAGAADLADVILWDAGASSERAARAARRSELRALAGPASLPVVVLVHDSRHAGELIRAGARGALLRQADVSRLKAALIAAATGLCVVDVALELPPFSPELAAPVDRGQADPELDEQSLTEREHEVLVLVAGGLSNLAIARKLDLSIHTIKFHVAAILAKLNADSRTGAVASAVRQGLLRL